MSSPVTARSQASQFGYHAEFAATHLSLLAFDSGLHDALIRRFKAEGAHLSRLKTEALGSDLSQANITCWLQDNNYVRVFASEIHSLLQMPPSAAVCATFVENAVGAVLDVDDQLSFSTHTVSLEAHATIDETTVEDFLEKFLQQPPEFFGAVTSATGCQAS